ncbi:MAG: ATP synthase F1 subunit epsilon [Ignavibacteriae bacterium]|jgi:F-type H+-transporting ATPase subunit epsilon|nr:ATP synthase F1 subunit epsilon [Ignavibacteriota bacterium]
MKEIKLEIVTPSKTAFSGAINSISVPGTSGAFQVLYNHAPILSSFEIGVIKISDSNNNELIFATSGGTIEVLENKILILAESLERPKEIDINRAEKAKDRAKERLASKGKEIDQSRAEAALQRAINRIKVSKNYS